ncbi:MAG: CoA ester lyase [Nitrososphaerota archaeon]
MLRSLLFVPANVERFVRKAPETGADAVVLDLEDSVPEGAKAEARRGLARSAEEIRSRSGQLIAVRVNSVGSGHLEDDVRAVADSSIGVVVLPKCEGPEHVKRLRELASEVGVDLRVIALIESPRGVLSADLIASVDGVMGLAFGKYDYSLAMGILPSANANVLVPRSLVAIAAKAHNLIAVDTPYAVLNDPDGLRAEALEARSLGYDGKFAVHPSQVPVINEVFSPSERDLIWAREVVEVLERARREGRASAELRGVMVDEVHYRIAKRILDGWSGTAQSESVK